jgi:hypothetical protein
MRDTRKRSFTAQPFGQVDNDLGDVVPELARDESGRLPSRRSITAGTPRDGTGGRQRLEVELRQATHELLARSSSPASADVMS